MLKDGAPTASTGNANGPVSEDPLAPHSTDAAAEAAAAELAGATIYTIGVGVNANTTTYLTNDIASAPGNYYGIDFYTDLAAILENLIDCPNQGGDERGAIQLSKVFDGQTAEVTLSIGTTQDGEDVDSGTLGGDGTIGENIVAAGTYYVSESDLNGYISTLACYNDVNDNDAVDGDDTVHAVDTGTGAVVIGANEDVICVFTNEEIVQDVDVAFNPNAATDTSGISLTNILNGAELTALTTSDNSYYTTNGTWGWTGTHNAADVFDLSFPDIPGGATVNSVSLNFEWQRDGGDLVSPRIMYSTNGGTTFSLAANITNPAVNTDNTAVLNLFALGVDTPAEVNGLVIRFQALYDGSGGADTTSHDWVQVDVNYTP